MRELRNRFSLINCANKKGKETEIITYGLTSFYRSPTAATRATETLLWTSEAAKMTPPRPAMPAATASTANTERPRTRSKTDLPAREGPRGRAGKATDLRPTCPPAPGPRLRSNRRSRATSLELRAANRRHPTGEPPTESLPRLGRFRRLQPVRPARIRRVFPDRRAPKECPLDTRIKMGLSRPVFQACHQDHHL